MEGKRIERGGIDRDKGVRAGRKEVRENGSTYLATSLSKLTVAVLFDAIALPGKAVNNQEHKKWKRDRETRSEEDMNSGCRRSSWWL